MKKIMNFSGGRTSGLMLRNELDRNPNYREEFTTVFCNTGKERTETLDFVNAVETNWNIPIVWLEYKRFPASTISAEIFPTPRRQENHRNLGDELTHWFRIVDYTTASRDGKPFDDLLTWTSALPNAVGRSCSSELKIRTVRRYAFSIGAKEFEAWIGIRHDEAHRAIQIQATCENFLHPKFPLIENKITVQDVEAFWKSQSFDLALNNYEGNCDLCFLKSNWKRRRIMRDNPLLAAWWIKKEREQITSGSHQKPSTFRDGETYEATLIDSLMPEFDFTANNQDIPCSCAERGFEKEE